MEVIHSVEDSIYCSCSTTIVIIRCIQNHDNLVSLGRDVRILSTYHIYATPPQDLFRLIPHHGFSKADDQEVVIKV